MFPAPLFFFWGGNKTSALVFLKTLGEETSKTIHQLICNKKQLIQTNQTEAAMFEGFIQASALVARKKNGHLKSSHVLHS